MPNWAFTSYVVTGPKTKRIKLFNMMRRLQNMPEPGLVENGFGSRWLGNLVTALKEDWNNVYCRGDWDNLQCNEDTVTFSTETAWCEMKDVRHLIEDKFPGLKLYYCTEEEGMGEYYTNDSQHIYFEDLYHLYIEDQYDDFCSSPQELIEIIKKYTGIKGLKTFQDCVKKLEKYSEDNDICCGVYEYQIVE